jgi:hypothetical protein
MYSGLAFIARLYMIVATFGQCVIKRGLVEMRNSGRK